MVVADETGKQSQKTQPKGRDEKGDPVKPADIPVPKRSEFDRLLDKAEKPPKK